MNKVAHYLQEHLRGEVSASPGIRKAFATDGSIFTVLPSLVVYPRSEADVRKTARFTWQLAERGRVIPITARGLGTDQSGAALGTGIVMAFPAHMHRILEFDGKTGDVIVEPGITFGKLQQTLQTHGRCLPCAPASAEYSTVGGAIANNASGEKSFKYGAMRQFTKSLRVVLANGELIETRRLSKRELSKKMGLTTFEGEMYRALDALIEEHKQQLADAALHVSKNTAGYALTDVKRKDGSFDLTPLMVGSQGTLGIVTDATLSTLPYSAETTVVTAFVDDLHVADQILNELRALPESPSAIEMVDQHLLDFVDRQNPNQLSKIIEKPFSQLVLFIEFDHANQRVQKKLVKRATKILSKAQVKYEVATDEADKDRLWQVRHAAASLLAHQEGKARALPIIDDGIVPADKTTLLISKMYELFDQHKLPVAVWGHAGDANLHVQPFFDLAQVGDRQKVFRIIEDYYSLVISLGGSTSGSFGDGRLRAPYLKKLYGDALYDIFEKTKRIFDPHNTLNPGVKIDVDLEDIKPLVRQEYSLDHLAHHLPRT